MTKAIFSAALVLFLASANSALGDTFTWDVHVDTSSIAGTTGNLQFVLQPPFATTVTLSDFTSDATLLSYSDVVVFPNDLTGTLPGTVTMRGTWPTEPYVDYAEHMTFGSFFDVFVSVDLARPDIDADGVLTMYVDNQVGGVHHANPLGPGPLFSVNTTQSHYVYTVAGNDNVTISSGETATPEPAPIALCIFGLAAIFACPRTRWLASIPKRLAHQA